MSRCWDLDIGADARQPSARVRLIEHKQCDVGLEIEYVDFASLSTYLDDDDLRLMRDWISWYLDEGPEPET